METKINNFWNHCKLWVWVQFEEARKEIWIKSSFYPLKGIWTWYFKIIFSPTTMCSLYRQIVGRLQHPRFPTLSPDSEWSSKSIIIGIYIEIQILTIDYNTCHANVLIRIQLSEFSNKFLRFQNVYNESSRELKSFFLEKNFFAHYTYSILILNFPPWNVAGKFERNIKH